MAGGRDVELGARDGGAEGCIFGEGEGWERVGVSVGVYFVCVGGDPGGELDGAGRFRHGGCCDLAVREGRIHVGLDLVELDLLPSGEAAV